MCFLYNTIVSQPGRPAIRPINSHNVRKVVTFFFFVLVFTMSTLQIADLLEHVSRINDQYCCKIEKVEFLPGVIRVFIDARGDDSRGIQIF
jgi:hypothetical protein